MKSYFSRLKKILLLGIPLILGMIGFVLVAGEPFLQSLFLTASMYVMNYQDVPSNLWIEIARWTAPLATASGIVMAMTALRERLHNYILYRSGKSTAVYGPEAERGAILAQLGKSGIDGKDEFVRAQKYILLGTEEENLAFYQNHQTILKDKTVYLKCCSLPAQASANDRLRLFSPEETAARLFWKEHCLYAQSAACNHKMNIVILGFGKLGEELLISALQNNIFSPEQQITYHVFAKDTNFSAVHSELSQITDPVIFYEQPWYTQLDFMEQAQAVIVLEQENQLTMLRELLLAVRKPSVYVFTSNQVGVNILAAQERLFLFDWHAEAQKLDNILGDLLYERAKCINLRYANLYGNVPETQETKEAEWEKLDAFTRYSNISSADYHEVQRKMLTLSGQSTDVSQLSAQWLELLSELEHIRWCRYHYLNNWKYGIPKNGKAKDKEQRIHSALVPYASLDETEKEKDRENIRILFSVQ